MTHSICLAYLTFISPALVWTWLYTSIQTSSSAKLIFSNPYLVWTWLQIRLRTSTSVFIRSLLVWTWYWTRLQISHTANPYITVCSFIYSLICMPRSNLSSDETVRKRAFFYRLVKKLLKQIVQTWCKPSSFVWACTNLWIFFEKHVQRLT